MEWLQVFSFFNFLKRKKLWKISKIVVPCPSPYHDHMEDGYPLYKPYAYLPTSCIILLRVSQEKNETGFFKHCDNITYDYAD